MKNQYESPEISLSKIGKKDVISTSAGEGGDTPLTNAFK